MLLNFFRKTNAECDGGDISNLFLVAWAMRVVMFQIIRLALLRMTNQRPGAVPGHKTAGKSDFWLVDQLPVGKGSL
jgi:hypothetical protein